MKRLLEIGSALNHTKMAPPSWVTPPVPFSMKVDPSMLTFPVESFR